MSTTLAPPVEETLAPDERLAPEPGTIAYEAERMDRLFPGWYERINTETLDLHSCERCIIGQSVGWDFGFHILFQDRIDRGEEGFQGRGFYAFQKYKHEWVKEINERRNR